MREVLITQLNYVAEVPTINQSLYPAPPVRVRVLDSLYDF